MNEEYCQECANLAQRKCTGCGGLFCNLHIRYGNPLWGGVGYYCDRCWRANRREAEIRKWVWVVVGLVGMIGMALIWFLVT